MCEDEAMKEPLFVRPLSESERAALQAGLRSSQAFTLRRSQILLASAARQTPRQISRQLGCTDQTVRNVLRAFAGEGLACLQAKSSRPLTVSPELDEAKREQLRAILHQPPRRYGKTRSLWTLNLAWIFATGIVPLIRASSEPAGGGPVLSGRLTGGLRVGSG